MPDDTTKSEPQDLALWLGVPSATERKQKTKPQWYKVITVALSAAAIVIAAVAAALHDSGVGVQIRIVAIPK